MRRVRDELGGSFAKASAEAVGDNCCAAEKNAINTQETAHYVGNLTQIQDLAGCRVIVPAIEDVKRIVEFNINNSVHNWFKDYDYISRPKADGYRCFTECSNSRNQTQMRNFIEIDVRYRSDKASAFLGNCC